MADVNETNSDDSTLIEAHDTVLPERVKTFCSLSPDYKHIPLSEQLLRVLLHPLSDSDRRGGGQLHFYSHGTRRWSMIVASYDNARPDVTTPYNLQEVAVTSWTRCRAPQRAIELCWTILGLKNHSGGYKDNPTYLENVDRLHIECTLGLINHWLETEEPYSDKSFMLKEPWYVAVKAWHDSATRDPVQDHDWSGIFKQSIHLSKHGQACPDRSTSNRDKTPIRPPPPPHFATAPSSRRFGREKLLSPPSTPSPDARSRMRSRSADSAPLSPATSNESSLLQNKIKTRSMTSGKNLKCYRDSFPKLKEQCEGKADQIIRIFTGLSLAEYKACILEYDAHTSRDVLNWPWFDGVYTARERAGTPKSFRQEKLSSDAQSTVHCPNCSKRHLFTIRRGLVMLVAIGTVDQRLWNEIHTDCLRYEVSHLYPLSSNINPLHIVVESYHINGERKKCVGSNNTGRCDKYNHTPKCNHHAFELFNKIRNGPSGADQTDELQIAMFTMARANKPMLNAYVELKFVQESAQQLFESREPLGRNSPGNLIEDEDDQASGVPTITVP